MGGYKNKDEGPNQTELIDLDIENSNINKGFGKRPYDKDPDDRDDNQGMTA